MPQALPFVGPIVGGVMGKDASENAADAQTNAANLQAQTAREALGFAKEQYGQTRSDLAPWLQSGGVSLDNLNFMLGIEPGGAAVSPSGDPVRSSGQIAGNIGAGGPGALLRQFNMSDFQNSPAYQFNMQQGLDAINKAARRSGRAYAPSTLQDIARFSQGLASNEFNNERNAFRNWQGDVFNRLSGNAGAGQNAAVQLGGFGGQAANSVGNSLNQVGNAAINAGNAQAAGIVGGANAISGGISGAYNNYLTDQIVRNAQRPTYTGGNYEPPTGTEWQMYD